MRVTVLGGSGQLGAAICHELCHEHSVTSYQRSTKKTHTLNKLPVKLEFGDFDELDFEQVFAETDWVIDASAPYPLQANTPTSQLNSYVRRYKRAFVAAAKAEIRYSYISSFITMEREALPVASLPNTLLQHIHPYYALKFRIEAIACHYADVGHNVNIYCPSVCMGPWDHRTGAESILSMLKNGELPFSSRHVIDIVDVRDVAGFICRPESAVADRGRKRPVFGHQTLISDFCNVASQILGVSAPPVVPDMAAFSPTALVAEATTSVLGGDNVLSALPILLAMESYELANPAATVAKYSLSDTIRDAATYATTPPAEDRRGGGC